MIHYFLDKREFFAYLILCKIKKYLVLLCEVLYEKIHISNCVPGRIGADSALPDFICR
jgi:hypothetical protein